MRRLACLLLSLLLSAQLVNCRRSTDEAVSTTMRRVELVTNSGLRLAADFFPSDNPGSAALILVPMLGKTRDTYTTFAREAQRQGYAAIALDLRGHGDSEGPDGLSFRAFQDTHWRDALNDLAAARRFLVDEGCDGDNIGLVGASIGANLVLRYAADHPEVPGVALLSPGRVYKGVNAEEALETYGQRPILLVVGNADAYSAQSCQTMDAMAEGQCELREYDSAAHGTEILDRHRQATNQIFLWLKPIIPPQRPPLEREATDR